MKPNTLYSRRGFTLIELLVVIAILSTLVALGAGAFFRVRAVQVKAATNTTVIKLNSGLMDRWKEIGEQAKLDAKKNHPGYNVALGLANQNSDAALSLWMYAKIKNELPMSFPEAKNNVTLNGTTVLQARTAFAQLPATAPGNVGDARLQSAVCFYLAMTASGNSLDTDSLNNQTSDVTVSGGTFRCFKDSWGTPITFLRQCYVGELNGKPYMLDPNGAYDPFDRSRKNAAVINGRWADILANLNVHSLSIMGVANPAFVGTAPNFNYNAGYNFVPTLVSAGQNRTFDGTPFGQDDIVGFRLLQQGAQGD